MCGAERGADVRDPVADRAELPAGLIVTATGRLVRGGNAQDRGDPVDLGDACGIVADLGELRELASERGDRHVGMLVEVGGQRPQALADLAA